MAVTVIDSVKELRAEARSGPLAPGRLEFHLTNIEAAATYQRDMEVWKVNFQTAVQAGQAALKAGILINGAAAVALLAFVQNLITSSKNHVQTASGDREGAVVQSLAAALVLGGVPAPVLKNALMSFLVGVAAAAFATAFAYLTQFTNRKWVGLGFQTAAIVFGLGSLVAFVVGGFFSARLW
jgi:hypothetical protein